ncbi:hypothetical protein ACFE04_002581 [Oxalis oulophora]
MGLLQCDCDGCLRGIKFVVRRWKEGGLGCCTQLSVNYFQMPSLVGTFLGVHGFVGQILGIAFVDAGDLFCSAAKTVEDISWSASCCLAGHQQSTGSMGSGYATMPNINEPYGMEMRGDPSGKSNLATS